MHITPEQAKHILWQGAFFYHILAWIALANECRIRSVLTICQMFWIMTLQPWLIALCTLMAGFIGYWICVGLKCMVLAIWNHHLEELSVLLDLIKGFGLTVGVSAGFTLFILLAYWIQQKSEQCKVIWRRK